MALSQNLTSNKPSNKDVNQLDDLTGTENNKKNKTISHSSNSDKTSPYTSIAANNIAVNALKPAQLLHLTPKQNHLLAAVPMDEFNQFANDLKLVYLPLGEALYAPDKTLTHAYFPITCIVSLHYVMESGASAETASVGNEGVVGLSLLMGGDSTPSSATVLIAGYAYKLESHLLKRAFKQHAALNQLLLRYVQVLLTQIAQTAVCNRHHSIEQQLSRWLLLTIHRLSTNELNITQELVSGMLGVRRESITQAASNLQRLGLISYRRGHISVLNSKGLEKHVCECYQVVQAELQRLLPR